MKKPPFVVPSTTRRDLIVGLGIGAVILTFVVLGIMNMSGGVVGNTLTGTVTEKKFIPQAEEQVTIGKGGVHARHLDGEYLLFVRVGKADYEVEVEKKTYDAKQIGEPFIFPRPPK
ncbi:MAG: hypothetical protein WCP06_00425 [Verrucomicrobiota bacterium]